MRGMTIAVGLLAWTVAAVAADATKPPKPPKMPLLERFSCRTGPNDHQARLIVEVVKGRVMEFAFYSRLGTGVCSIHGRRGDAYTKWEDDAAVAGKAAIKLLTGSAELEYKLGHVKLKFTDVDRMRYCGMDGELNGAVEVISKKPECGLVGVFD